MAAARCLGIVLRHEGRHQIADQVTLAATARLEATGLTLPVQSAAYAQMLCTCAERRGRLHTDLARAWWQWGKPDQAARALLAAHRQAPAEIRGRPAIRTIVTDLLERHPRVVSVRELAAVVGHPASPTAAERIAES